MSDDDPTGLPFLLSIGKQYSFEEIPQLLELVTKAAIHADLRHQGYVYEDGAYYEPQTLGGRVGPADPDNIDPENLFTGLPVKRAVTVTTLKWTSRISTAFQDFLTMPDPAWFDGEMQRVNGALSSVAIFSQFSQGGDNGVMANPKLAGAITTLEERTGELRGRYIEVFNEYYASKVGPVVSTFGGAIYPLALALRGEQAIWARGRQSVPELAQAAWGAFRTSAPDGSGIEEMQNFLGVAGAVLSIVAIPLTGGASIAAAVASAAIGASSTAMSFLPTEDPQTVELGGPHPDAVYDNLLEALATLNQQIKDEEIGIRETIGSCMDAISGSNEFRVNIRRPGLVDADDSNQVLSKVDLFQNRGIIDRLAHNHIPVITTTLSKVTDELGSNPSIWQRSNLGLGTIGPWEDYERLRSYLIPKVLEVCAELNRAARILWESYLLIERADDAADHDLRSLQNKLPNDPTSNSHITPNR